MEDHQKLTPRGRLHELTERLASCDDIHPDNLLIAAEQVREIIGELHFSTDNRGSIKAVVSNFFGVHERAMSSKSRTRAHSEPRRIAMYLMRQETNMTLFEIGKQFNRDHTTVIYGIQTVRDEILRNPAFGSQVDSLRALLAKEAKKDDEPYARPATAPGDLVARAKAWCDADEHNDSALTNDTAIGLIRDLAKAEPDLKQQINDDKPRMFASGTYKAIRDEIADNLMKVQQELVKAERGGGDGN
tara:strand:+ start:2933 stop:3667 length:735 start_codon:yes stop_codon:yes gene_type:complete